MFFWKLFANTFGNIVCCIFRVQWESSIANNDVGHTRVYNGPKIIIKSKKWYEKYHGPKFLIVKDYLLNYDPYLLIRQNYPTKSAYYISYRV